MSETPSNWPAAPVSRPFLLLTGAAGRIGSNFRRAAGERYRFRLADRVITGLDDTPGGRHDIVQLDIADKAAVAAACAVVDVVVHLAADPSPEADWETSLLANNINGAEYVVQAALDAGVQRVVFASSVHAVMAYPLGIPIPDHAPARPENLYGVSKSFGEALCSWFASHGRAAIALRIGAYDAPWVYDKPDPDELTAYVSARDLNQLLVRAIETPEISFDVVPGISDNHPNRFDLSGVRARFGYTPVDGYPDRMTGPEQYRS